MKYDSGYLNERIRWVKLDGRNYRSARWSHRITIRQNLQILKFERYIRKTFGSDSIALVSFSWMFKDNTKNYLFEKRHETSQRSQFYLNEDTLIQVIMGYNEADW